MLHKVKRNNLTKNFFKTIFGITIALGFFGVGAKVYAYQTLPPRFQGTDINAPVYVTSFGCFEKSCTITTNAGTNHWFTSDGTASCDRGVFGWDNTKKPQIGKIVQQAFDQHIPVKLIYSEYHCYENNDGAGRPMELQAIFLMNAK
jgi:hypothetical protein